MNAAATALSALRAARERAAHTTTTATEETTIMQHAAPTVPAAPAPGFTIDPTHRDSIRAAMHAGIPALIAGPAGTGKTELIAAIAHAENRPLHIVDCGGVRDPLDWFGSLALANGRTHWEPTALCTALNTTGAIILLDEVNRASTISQNTLLPLLDSRRTVRLPGATITAHESAWIVATANEGAEYAATGAIDLALRSRLAVRIECTYLTPAAEAAMLVTRCGVDRDTAALISRVCAHTRRADWIATHQWSLDTRAALAVARMIAAMHAIGCTATIGAWQCAALAHASPDGISQSTRAALAQVLASHGIG